MIKYVIVLVVLCVGGCLPATQTSIQDLTTAVSDIVPAVRAAIASESDDTNDKIEIVLGRVEDLNEVVATAEDPLDAAEMGWGATELWNPYYGYGVLGLGILRLVLGKRKVTTALEEVVVGIDDSKNGAAHLGETLKNSLKAAASMDTRKLVDSIRKVI
jgi:hypothetical protein